MSTNDELSTGGTEPTRPGPGPAHDAGFADSAHDSGASGPGHDPGTTGPTQIMDTFDSTTDEEPPATRWHAGLDIGLLLLRIAIGGTLVLHGLQKLGLFDDMDIDGFAAQLEGIGFSQATALAWVTAITEVGAGTLLLLGLFTPLAAAGGLGVMISAVYTSREIGYFPEMLGEGVIPGYNFPLLIGAGALVLLCTGPGRAALDAATPWRRNPLPYGLFGILLAAGAATAVIALFG